MAEPENAVPKQDGRFRPGQSGNPAGKPRGARNKASVLAERMMAEDAEGVVNAVLASAKGGDMVAARIVLDRLYPVRRDNPVNFSLPPIESAADASRAMGSIFSAVSTGELSPLEAQTIAGVLESYVKALELCEFEGRLAALEKERSA
jgi:hypothetical protein